MPAADPTPEGLLRDLYAARAEDDAGAIAAYLADDVTCVHATTCTEGVAAVVVAIQTNTAFDAPPHDLRERQYGNVAVVTWVAGGAHCTLVCRWLWSGWRAVHIHR